MPIDQESPIPPEVGQPIRECPLGCSSHLYNPMGGYRPSERWIPDRFRQWEDGGALCKGLWAHWAKAHFREPCGSVHYVHNWKKAEIRWGFHLGLGNLMLVLGFDSACREFWRWSSSRNLKMIGFSASEACLQTILSMAPSRREKDYIGILS